MRKNVNFANNVTNQTILGKTGKFFRVWNVVAAKFGSKQSYQVHTFKRCTFFLQ